MFAAVSAIVIFMFIPVTVAPVSALHAGGIIAEDPFLIEVYTDISCAGSVTESSSFDWVYSNANLSDNNLTTDERVAQIRYDADMNADNGYVEYSKSFRADGVGVPNLRVDRKVGFIADKSLTGGLTTTENAGMFIASEGVTGGGSGAGVLCVWAQHACVPPSCENAIAGSQLRDVTRVYAHTVTTVQTTESPRLHHEITAAAAGGGNLSYGTVSAGMEVNVRCGNSCSNTVHPLGSQLRYSTTSTAAGRWNSFTKSMTYTSEIPAIQVPSRYPLFPWH